MKLSVVLRALWVLAKRAAYTDHVECMACPEVWHPMFGNPKLCPSCKTRLHDVRSRTTSKPRKVAAGHADAYRSEIGIAA